MLSPNDDLNENDDEAERATFRQKRLAEQAVVASPRRANHQSGMELDSVQLADHYVSCIKLSAENKINAKNAFRLHLIDFMTDMLRKQENNNFQFASSTLDASTKIYAGRVDAIHTETYKMLGGLGMSAEVKEPTGDGPTMEDGDETANGDPEAKKKKRLKKKSKTICTNLKTLTVDKFDTQFDVDPYFQKNSAAFSEIGSGGLLLNHLSSRADNIELVLDCNVPVYAFDEDWEGKGGLVDLGVATNSLKEVLSSSAKICPSFVTFNFKNWNRGDAESWSQERSCIASDGAFQFDGGAPPMDMDDDDHGAEPLDGGTQIYATDVAEARLQTDENMAEPTVGSSVGDLVQLLAPVPSDYSYFHPMLMRSWAGPGHWKFRAVEKAKDEEKKPQKKKKPLFRVTFDKVLDDMAFAEPKSAVTLSRETLERHHQMSNDLPNSYVYAQDTLLRTALKRDILIQRRKQTEEIPDLEENLQNYNYDAPADRDYCPLPAPAEDSDDNEGFGFALSDASQMDPSQPEPSQGNLTLSEERLIPEPWKVDRLDLVYAKQAKKIDMKRLKLVMWDFLSASKNEDSTVAQRKQTVTGVHSFGRICSRLSKRIPPRMAEDLSTPIAFIGLLHLANEKNLCLTGNDGLSEILVTQDTGVV